MRISKLSKVALCAVIAVGSIVSTAGVANAATPSPLATQDIDGVRVSGAPKLANEAALLRYVATNATATTIDSSSGELVSVAPAPKASTRISERNTCQSGDAYWEGYAVPYTNNCFYGSKGTYLFPKNGTTSNTFRMGKYTARGAWLSGGKTIWGPKQGPGSVSRLTGNALVKGAQIF